MIYHTRGEHANHYTTDADKPFFVYIQLTRDLEFDGTMEKIWVNRSSTQEELRKYQKCSLLNDERETTRAKFWRAKKKFFANPFHQKDIFS